MAPNAAARGPNLFLQVRLPEGQQEPLDVLGAQAVDAARVDGPPQELVHLVLWVHAFLRVPENEMPESQKTRVQPKVQPVEEEESKLHLSIPCRPPLENRFKGHRCTHLSLGSSNPCMEGKGGSVRESPF